MPTFVMTTVSSAGGATSNTPSFSTGRTSQASTPIQSTWTGSVSNATTGTGVTPLKTLFVGSGYLKGCSEQFNIAPLLFCRKLTALDCCSQ